MTTDQYIDNINKRYNEGNATEHSFRGDLQQLIESLVAGGRVGDGLLMGVFLLFILRQVKKWVVSLGFEGIFVGLWDYFREMVWGKNLVFKIESNN